MDFTAVLAFDAAEIEAPRGYNGAEVSVDISQPSTHVALHNMMVFTATNQVDLLGTWTYAIWAAQGYPTEATQVTSGHMEAAASRLKDAATIHSLLALCSHITVGGAAMVTDIRLDDALPQVEVENLIHIHGPTCSLAANRFWAFLAANGPARARFYSESKMGLMMLCMNQMHRELCEGHQWHSTAATDPKTQTGRCTAMAGAYKDEFMAWLAIKHRGHDMWHFLGNQSLARIVYAIIGKSNEVVSAVAQFQYLGTDHPIGPMDLSRLVVMSESVKDRLPSGTIGVSGIIVGVEFTAEMFEWLSSRSDVEGGAGTITAINSAKAFLGGTTLDRGQLMRLKTAFLPLVATAVGFKGLTAAGRDQVAGYEGLSSYVKQDIKNHGRGKMMAEAFEKIQVTPDKLAELLRSLHEEARIAFTAMVDMGANDVEMDPIGEVVVAKTPEQKREERNEAEDRARHRNAPAY